MIRTSSFFLSFSQAGSTSKPTIALNKHAKNAEIGKRTSPKPDDDVLPKKRRKTGKPKVATTVSQLAATIQNKYFAKPQGEGAQTAGELGKGTNLKRWFE